MSFSNIAKNIPDIQDIGAYWLGFIIFFGTDVIVTKNVKEVFEKKITFKSILEDMMNKKIQELENTREKISPERLLQTKKLLKLKLQSDIVNLIKEMIKIVENKDQKIWNYVIGFEVQKKLELIRKIQKQGFDEN